MRDSLLMGLLKGECENSRVSFQLWHLRLQLARLLIEERVRGTLQDEVIQEYLFFVRTTGPTDQSDLFADLQRIKLDVILTCSIGM